MSGNTVKLVSAFKEVSTDFWARALQRLVDPFRKILGDLRLPRFELVVRVFEIESNHRDPPHHCHGEGVCVLIDSRSCTREDLSPRADPIMI